MYAVDMPILLFFSRISQNMKISASHPCIHESVQYACGTNFLCDVCNEPSFINIERYLCRIRKKKSRKNIFNEKKHYKSLAVLPPEMPPRKVLLNPNFKGGVQAATSTYTVNQRLL